MCDLFPSVVTEVEEVIEKTTMPHEVKEEMKFVVFQSKKNVNAWKAHILRSINQDEARLDILDALDDDTVLVTLDWAMKMIPRKYRESQADWFGKKGMSWHISVAVRKKDGKLQTLSLIHIFQRSNQDSFYVLAIIDDVLSKLKSAIPGLKNVNFREDNAGCYHSAATILGVQQLARKYELNVRMDFSDPQGGKGACDRKAATVKTHMKGYLNSGKDIENAEQMKDAVDSNGGVRGVFTVLCDTPTIPDATQFPKWEGVSLVNDVKFQDTSMRVWRAYKVGDGKDIPYTKFNLKELAMPCLNKIKDVSKESLSFSLIQPRKTSVKSKAPTLPSPDESDTDNDTLFTCPEDGCIKSYQRYSSLQHHLDSGRHKYALERMSLLDRAMLQYAENLESGASVVEKSKDTGRNNSNVVKQVEMGWALKQSVSNRRRFNESQKKYLRDIFDLGEQTGRKADPNQVSKLMRKAQKEDGSLLFSAEEYMTTQQISSYFSRLSSKKSLSTPQSVPLSDEEDEDDLEAAMVEANLDQMQQEVMQEIAIQHPIVYDTYNLCEISDAKLKSFSVKMLQDMCKYFSLNTSIIKQKRKQPYISLIKELLGQCSCK